MPGQKGWSVRFPEVSLERDADLCWFGKFRSIGGLGTRGRRWNVRYIDYFCLRVQKYGRGMRRETDHWSNLSILQLFSARELYMKDKEWNRDRRKRESQYSSWNSEMRYNFDLPSRSRRAWECVNHLRRYWRIPLVIWRTRELIWHHEQSRVRQPTRRPSDPNQFSSFLSLSWSLNAHSQRNEYSQQVTYHPPRSKYPQLPSSPPKPSQQLSSWVDNLPSRSEEESRDGGIWFACHLDRSILFRRFGDGDGLLRWVFDQWVEWEKCVTYLHGLFGREWNCQFVVPFL